MTHPNRRAYLWACALDVAVRKPGNVSLASPGHAMTAEQFLTSAVASADGLLQPGARVGKRIEAAVAATRAAAGCNTNLGIVLLCAPLAAAGEALQGSSVTPAALRNCVRETLARLDVDDARAAYRAIALANPAGLGNAPEQDVHGEPTRDLRSAMELAADRDRIAWQFANGFAEVFDIGLAAFERHAPVPELAMLAAYLGFLASAPDSHTVRKHGFALAHSVTKEARRCLDRWIATGRPPEEALLAKWDDALKARGVNPGTSADLAVASAFLAAIADPRLSEAQPPALAWKVFSNGPTL